MGKHSILMGHWRNAPETLEFRDGGCRSNRLSTTTVWLSENPRSQDRNPDSKSFMRQLANTSVRFEHSIYLVLFISNGGGW
jgi:hypothetical protein